MFARTCPWRLSPSEFTETPFTSPDQSMASGVTASPSRSRLHTCFSFPFVAAVHEASDEVSSMSSSMTPSSLFPYHTPWRTSTTQKRGCLEHQTHLSSLSTLPIVAVFSLFPFHSDIVTRYAPSVQESMLLWTSSLPTPSAPRKSFHSTFGRFTL